jgi:hypothetical protein
VEPAKSKRIRRLARGVLLPFALLEVASAAHASLAISTAPTSHVTCSAGTCTAQAPDAVLNVTKLTHLLHQGDTQVVAGVAQAIDIEAPLAWTKPSRLTLSATTGITVAQPVAVQGTGAVTLTTSDTSAGAIAFVRGGKLDFWDLSSNLTINGNTYVLANDVATLAADIAAANMYGYFALARDYDAGADAVHKTSPIYGLFGSLNGLGHTISNLRIRSVENSAGFIAYLVRGSNSYMLPSATNLTLSAIDLSARAIGSGQPNTYVGGLTGFSQGTISHVRVTGRVKGDGDWALVGGIAGLRGSGGGTPMTLDSSADVTVSGSGAALGGIVAADLDGGILRCAVTGKIEGSRATDAGGLAAFVGSLPGESIADNWSSARVSGAEDVGGLVGHDETTTTLMDNYATGVVSGSKHVGGLIGSHGGSLASSYASGPVSGDAGALIGGVIGTDVSTQANASAYWDLNRSGISNPAQGAGNVSNDPGLTGLTHAQMKSGLPVGFDPAVWGQSAQVNNGYPYLLANPPPQ